MIRTDEGEGKSANVTGVTKVSIRCPAREGDWPDGLSTCNDPLDVLVSGTDEDGYQVVAVGFCKTGHRATVEDPTPWNGGAFSYEAVQQMLDEGSFRVIA